MEVSQRTFSCDETPTPTRFIRNCEEVGLFQDLQNNPFEETFRNAVQTKRNNQTLPEPLSKCVNADTLDTPQVVPNSKRIEDYRNSYPIIEDEDDDINPNDYLIEYMLPKEDNLHDEDEKQLDDTLLVQNIEADEIQDDVISKKPYIEPAKEVIDLTSSPISDETFNFKSKSIQNEVIEEIFLEEQSNLSNSSITNEFLILHNKKETKENTFSSVVVSSKNLMSIFSKSNDISDESSVRILPKPSPPAPPTIKQKLKNLLKPNQSNIADSVPIVVQKTKIVHAPEHSSTEETNEDKLLYSRERNRIAQKRCRLKKKKLISQLKQDTESVYNENRHLRSEIVSLKAEVAHLKTLLLAHKNCPVTLAMYQDVSNVVQKETPRKRAQISSKSTKTTPVAVITTGTQNFRVTDSKINQSKKIVLNSQNISILPVSHLNPDDNTPVKLLPNLQDIDKNQSLKIIINKNSNTSNSSSNDNSPNAVKVICYNQNIPDISNLTYDNY